MTYSFAHVFLGSEIPSPTPIHTCFFLLLFEVDFPPPLQILTEKIFTQAACTKFIFLSKNCLVVADSVSLSLFAVST